MDIPRSLVPRSFPAGDLSIGPGDGGEPNVYPKQALSIIYVPWAAVYLYSWEGKMVVSGRGVSYLDAGWFMLYFSQSG